MDTSQLPIRNYKNEIIDALKHCSVIVVIGEAGSGKTTQIPQLLHEAGYTKSGCIGVTQPRRVAAISAARRVAYEMGTDVGDFVGYAVRFDEMYSNNTAIKYLTDGTLLRECLLDPSLDKYSVLMLDEAHERSLNTDILFGIVRELLENRKTPLKVLVTSATLDGEKFSKYFLNCQVLNIAGTCFPISIVYSREDHLKNYMDAALEVVMDIHVNKPPGDILLFLTGQSEIKRAVELLNTSVQNLPEGFCEALQVLPLYAALPLEQQSMIFRKTPSNCRRVVVATNIAETSITVEGIVYVIDPGTVKQKIYDPSTGMECLQIVTISHVQAQQRAGRAGRTQKGICYRLYSKNFYDEEMTDFSLPEIKRTSLVSTVLYLKSLKMNIDILNFKFLDPPQMSQLEDALRQLYILGAIDGDGVINNLGIEMSKFPLDPSLSRAIIAASELGCTVEMLKIASMLSVENIFSRGDLESRKKFGEDGKIKKTFVQEVCSEGYGDHISYLKIFEKWEHKHFSKEWCEREGLDFRSLRFVNEVYKQLTRVVRDMGLLYLDNKNHDDRNEWPKNKLSSKEKEESSSSINKIRRLKRALAYGSANKVAHRMAAHNGYRPLNPGAPLSELHPSSCKLHTDEDGLLPKWIIFHELVQTSRPFLSKVCLVEETWIAEVLGKIRNININRLSGKKFEGHLGNDKNDDETKINFRKEEEGAQRNIKRRNNDTSVAMARKRFLERKTKKTKILSN